MSLLLSLPLLLLLFLKGHPEQREGPALWLASVEPRRRLG